MRTHEKSAGRWVWDSLCRVMHTARTVAGSRGSDSLSHSLLWWPEYAGRTENYWPSLVFRHECEPTPPGSPVGTQMPFLPQHSGSVGEVWGLRVCVLNQFPHGAEAADLGTTLGTTL